MKSKIAIAIYIVLVSALTIIAGSRDTIIGAPECKHMVVERNGWDVGWCIEGTNLLMRCETAIPHYDTSITYGKCSEKKPYRAGAIIDIDPDTDTMPHIYFGGRIEQLKSPKFNGKMKTIIFESMGKEGK